MAFEKEKQVIEAITEKHADVPVRPDFSAPAANLLAHRCQTMNVAVPLVVRRFMERAHGPRPASN